MVIFRVYVYLPEGKHCCLLIGETYDSQVDVAHFPHDFQRVHLALGRRSIQVLCQL